MLPTALPACLVADTEVKIVYIPPTPTDSPNSAYYLRSLLICFANYITISLGNDARELCIQLSSTYINFSMSWIPGFVGGWLAVWVQLFTFASNEGPRGESESKTLCKLLRETIIIILLQPANNSALVGAAFEKLFSTIPMQFHFAECFLLHPPTQRTNFPSHSSTLLCSWHNNNDNNNRPIINYNSWCSVEESLQFMRTLLRIRGIS